MLPRKQVTFFHEKVGGFAKPKFAVLGLPDVTDLRAKGAATTQVDKRGAVPVGCIPCRTVVAADQQTRLGNTSAIWGYVHRACEPQWRAFDGQIGQAAYAASKVYLY